jgi:DNA polymerase-1
MTPGNAPEKLFLIDAHAVLFQVFHAIPEMTSPGGLPTNALFGFTRDIMALRKELKPDYLVVVFDPPGKTFRDAIYAEYKAHRGPMPDSMVTQIPMVYQMLQAMRVPQLTVEGFEADDVIATLARAGEGRGLDVHICTSDKDCRQLLSDRIRIYNLRKRELYDRSSLQRDWGIAPEQVIDFQTLVGDSVDNVPGVEGIGDKTASKLLQQYGTVENLLAHVDEVAGAKRKENLKAALPHLARTRELVTLKTDVQVPMAWDAWRAQPWEAPALLKLFQNWGFRGFAEQVRSSTPAPPAASSAPPPGDGAAVQGDLFADTDGEPAAAEAAPRPRDAWDYSKYELVNTPAKFTTFIEALAKQQRFAVDLETTGLDARQSELVGLAFSWKEGEAYYLAVRGPVGEPVLEVAEVLAQLRPVLEAATPGKVNQNIKFDLMALRHHGVHVQGVASDSMVAHYLLHADEREHNMQALCRSCLGHECIPITDLIGKRGKKQLRMDEVPTQRVAEYSGEDADVALRLCTILEKQVAEQGLDRLYRDLEVPLIEVLADLEYTGIRIDVPRLQKLSEEMTRQMEGLEKEIYSLAGHEFNIASLIQLRKVLFEELKLDSRKKTGITRQPSTDHETLEDLALVHELPRKLLEHRQVAKLKSTYVDALPVLVNAHTGRVHTSLHQTVAATGRLSSSDPNLQNIPIRTEQGGQIRQAFVPEEGWMLLAADYAQVELRLLAHFCSDEALRQAFAEDRDIHAAVAAQVFGVAEGDVTGAMRRVAKMVNFGVIYGISAFGLARRLEIPREEAQRFIDEYFAKYPRVLEYQDAVLRRARQQGYVGTLLGRRRRFDPKAIRANSTYQQRNQAEREAINMEIQGSAADLIKVAMLNVWRRLKSEGRRARMLLQIHDELVFEVPPDELPGVARLVHDEMARALADRLQVKLKVDVEAGPNWLETQPVAI